MGAAGREIEPSGWVWLNGTLLPEGEARVSLFDRGYLYGDGLFETMRAYGGKIFRLRQHLVRLTEGARELGLRLRLACSQIEQAAADLLDTSGLSDAYLRLTVSRGPGLGPLPKHNLKPTISLIARRLRLPSPQEYEKGWKAVLVESALSLNSQLSKVKSLSYLDKVLARIRAREAGADEALLVNSQGEIAEASTSNFFLLQEGRLLTPPLKAGLLRGITRETIMELAPRLSLGVSEATLTPEEVFSAQECFLTNSIMEVMPLTSLEGQEIGEGRRGPITAALHRAYQNLVVKELAHADTASHV